VARQRRWSYQLTDTAEVWSGAGPEAKYRLVRHNEMQPSNMEPGMVVVTIEHCTDCDKHDYTTRHDAAKYMDYVAKVQGAYCVCVCVSRDAIHSIPLRPSHARCLGLSQGLAAEAGGGEFV
jgi:hypothetical protein